MFPIFAVDHDSLGLTINTMARVYLTCSRKIFENRVGSVNYVAHYSRRQVGLAYGGSTH